MDSEKDPEILTSEISKATFGLTHTEYKQVICIIKNPNPPES